ncbi:MAG: ABC transporter substrate-binding protein [Pseudomonadota bacterium]
MKKTSWLKPFTVAASIVLGTSTNIVSAAEIDASWQDTLKEAAGQTVYFNAWGGSDRINGYIAWAAEQIDEQYGVKLEHVKIGDIAEVVSQLEAAKAVGRNDDGNVDLMWVNGENFANMKNNALTWGAFATTLPNAANLKDSESLTMDFSVPVEGLESPWGAAQLVFIYDTAVVEKPPASAAELLEFVNNGGRFAYPAPPVFHGTTIVKQLLHELTEDKVALAQPVSQADFDAVTAPLWDYLDQLHPKLWGKGESWPASAENTRQMVDDGELDISLSFNPNEASAAVRDGQLPESVRTYTFTDGTIGNTHFVTIPFNAKAKAGAKVVANFFISAGAQARKADPANWGDPTVLDIAKLDTDERALFNNIDLGPWALPIGSGKTLPEPHASWAEALEQAWLTRYGN